MYELLKLLEHNARYSTAQLATMLGTTEAEVQAAIAQYEKEGVIRGYATIVDWEKTEREYVSARIELKVVPEKNRGFEEVAEQISRFEEVRSLRLMSGGYDLAVTVVGKTFRDIASFVAYRLASLESVQSTATHFILRTYKENGVVTEQSKDERGVVL